MGVDAIRSGSGAGIAASQASQAPVSNTMLAEIRKNGYDVSEDKDQIIVTDKGGKGSDVLKEILARYKDPSEKFSEFTVKASNEDGKYIITRNPVGGLIKEYGTKNGCTINDPHKKDDGSYSFSFELKGTESNDDIIGSLQDTFGGVFNKYSVDKRDNKCTIAVSIDTSLWAQSEFLPAEAELKQTLLDNGRIVVPSGTKMGPPYVTCRMKVDIFTVNTGGVDEKHYRVSLKADGSPMLDSDGRAKTFSLQRTIIEKESESPLFDHSGTYSDLAQMVVRGTKSLDPKTTVFIVDPHPAVYR